MHVISILPRHRDDEKYSITWEDQVQGSCRDSWSERAGRDPSAVWTSVSMLGASRSRTTPSNRAIRPIVLGRKTICVRVPTMATGHRSGGAEGNGLPGPGGAAVWAGLIRTPGSFHLGRQRTSCECRW